MSDRVSRAFPLVLSLTSSCGLVDPREVLLETESIKTERAATPVFPGAFQFQRDDDGFLGDS